ncbi:unnamed protein product [Pylaiella littoralis]
MEHRGRKLWITISLLWMVGCFLVLHYAMISSITAAAGAAGRGVEKMAAAAATEARRYTSGIVVLVMPSPPSVSAPSTRIDRLETIRDTWGRDLVKGGRHSVVFVIDETDAITAEKAVQEWGGSLEAPPLSARRLGDRDRAPVPQPNRHSRNAGENNFRAIVVPDAVTHGGTDGDGRLRYAMETVAKAYDPAFLFFCNEHTFVIAENLQCFVHGLNPSKPMYLGNRFRKENQKEQGKALLNSGAAGFVLSRASLSLLVRAWRGGGGGGGGEEEEGGGGREDLSKVDFAGNGQNAGVGGGAGEVEGQGRPVVVPECTATSDFERGNPGVTLARCLQHVGVEAQDTTDTQGGQRFNAYGPVRLAQGMIDKWYKDVHASDPGMWRAGSDCCSSDTVSFHYVGPAEARAMHHILHHREKYIAKGGYEEALKVWPTSPQALGPYARRPTLGDAHITFDLLLDKIQLCSR